MKHRENAYIDSHKKIVFCEVCGLEDPELSRTPQCVGKYVPPQIRTIKNDNQQELFQKND